MRRFRYRAKRGPDETVEGEVTADDEAAALARIEARGLCPVWVRETDAELSASDRPARRLASRPVTVLTRQLAGLLRAGVPILKALRTLRGQTADERFRGVMADLENRVREGSMLSDALAAHPGAFPDLYVSMVRAGETAGRLDEVLLRLAESREREDEVRKRIRAALAYPVLVLAVGVLTVVVMVFFFLPRITVFFRSVRDLPWPTRVLLGLTDLVQHGWPWMAAGVVLAVALFRRLTSGAHGRLWLDRIKLRLPVVGRFILESDLARFARTLALLIEAGVPLERSLSLGAGALTNRVLRLEMEEVRRSTLREGRPVTVGLREARHFPEYARTMASTGEETGRLDESMATVASYYEKEVERRLGIIMSLIEPALILGVGAVVGFIVVSMMMPIFAISRSVQ